MLQFSKDLKAVLSNTRSQADFNTSAKRELQRKPRFGFNTHGNVIPVPNPGGKNVTIIAAMDNRNGIGKNNQIPWAISPDMQQFKRLTTGHPVIMGRKTFESLKGKPLPDRINIVLTRDIGAFYGECSHENLIAMPSLVDAVEATADEQIFIIGGAEIYRQALEHDLAHDMILTRIGHDAQCDTFFPEVKAGSKWQHPVYSTHELSSGVTMRYEYWQSCRYEDIYLKE